MILLQESDYERAAKVLNCEVACIKAVAQVESAGDGFLKDGRPKILFEAAIFSGLTGHAYDKSHPNISSLKWNRALYKGGALEYNRLDEAEILNSEIANKSTSWGKFQIMGFNFKLAGYSTIWGFIGDMKISEGKQLDAFVNFIKNSNLSGALKNKNWALFAQGYNGPGYAANQYDIKLAAAYKKLLP